MGQLKVNSLIVIIKGYTKVHDELLSLKDYEGAGWVMADITKSLSILEEAIKGSEDIDEATLQQAQELLKG